MTPNKQQLLKDFVTQQLQSAKQQTQPIVNPNGFKNGEPPAGSNWRIPGDTLYNPTPYPIQAVSDNGITKTLNPFDETSVQFPGAQYVDEYKMKFGGLPKYQGDTGPSEVIEDTTPRPTLEIQGEKPGLWRRFLQSYASPLNWGRDDLSDNYPEGHPMSNYMNVLLDQRRKGEPIFMWKNKRHTTQMPWLTRKEQLEQTGITDAQLYARTPFEEAVHENIDPFSYEDKGLRATLAFLGIKEQRRKDRDNASENIQNKPFMGARTDAFNLSMGKPQTRDTFSLSEYRPSKSGEGNWNDYKNDMDYFAINKFKDPKIQKELIDVYFNRLNSIDNLSKKYNLNPDLLNKLKESELEYISDSTIPKEALHAYLNEYGVKPSGNFQNDLAAYNELAQLNSYLQEYDPQTKNVIYTDSKAGVMGNFTLGQGVDENGKKYVSYYDLWDVDTPGGSIPFGKPYHIYDRMYYKNGGLTKYQKAGLTFEELMMQGMRPQMAASDATYYTNAQMQDAGKGESIEQKQKQASLNKRLKDEEIRKKKEALKAENERLRKEADARASDWFGTNINSSDYIKDENGQLRKITDEEKQLRTQLTDSYFNERAQYLIDKQNQSFNQDVEDFASEALPALAFEAAPYLLPFASKIGMQGLKSGMQGLSNAKKGTKNFLIAKQFSNQVNKTALPVEKPLQKLSARIDPIGRSSVNVENDIIKTYGRENYERAIDDLYARYYDAYNAPYIEFKSSRPSSMFEGIGSADNWPEGRLLKQRFCETGSECAKTSNAVTSKVYSEMTGQPFATNENAHNAWHLEDQMTRHGGRNVTDEVLKTGEFKIGDRILMGNGVDQSTDVPGYVADRSVRHAGMFAGYMPTENGLVPMLLESGATNPLFLNPVGHTITGPGSLRQVIRPQQFLDETFGRGLANKNVRYAFRDKPSVATYSSENPAVQSILTDAEQHRERIKRTHDLTNDEFDEMVNSLIGIGAQETKLNAQLPSPFLPAAKVKLQNALVDAGLTAPIKKTINVGKRIGNAVTSKTSSLPEYPGTSFIEMESAKLAESQNIPFTEALQKVKSQYQPKPRFTPSTVEPSKGMFRQKFQTEAGKTSGFNTDITQDELANGLSQMAENYAKIKQLYPDANPRDLINLTTLMWNSPGKAQNKELVDFFLFGKGNPNPSKFKFDYLDKVNRYRDQLINVHPQSVEPVHREFFRAGYPEIQYQKGGSTKGKEYKTPTGQSIYLDPNFKAYARYLDSNGNVIPVTELQKFSMIYDPQANTWDSTHSEKPLNVYDRRMSFEERINRSLGDPMGKAAREAAEGIEPGEDPVDNFRHPLAGMYTQQAIAEKTGNIPIVSPVLGWAGANILGLGHELGTIFSDERPLEYKGREFFEDLVNNAGGATIGLLPIPNKVKKRILYKASAKNMLPDGISNPDGRDFYFKKNGGSVLSNFVMSQLQNNR